MTQPETWKRDLAALAEDSRRAPLAVGDTLQTAGVYRDDRPGAEARRDALAEQRRIELALMPLTLAQVFARRVARAAAGATAVVGVAGGVADPELPRLAARVIPGLDVPTFGALFGGIVLAAYIVATWLAERAFERRMRSAVTTFGFDPHADLDRLAVGPLEVARRLVQRADAAAVALGIAGLTAAGAVFGFVAFAYGAAETYGHVWTPYDVARGLPLLQHNGIVFIGIALAVIGSVVVGRGCAPTGSDALRGRVLRHWVGLAAGLTLGFASLHEGLDMVRTTGGCLRVPAETQAAIVLLGVAGVFLVATWATLWWRRRELARIDAP